MSISSDQDLSQVPLEQLTAEEAQIRSSKTMIALLIGALFGVAIDSAVNGGFLLSVALMSFGFHLGKRNAQKLGRIQAEITRRSSTA